MKKKYTIEFLYDNGIKEMFITDEATEEDKEKISSYLIKIMKEDLKGTVTLKNTDGNKVTVNISKITRFLFLD